MALLRPLKGLIWNWTRGGGLWGCDGPTYRRKPHVPFQYQSRSLEARFSTLAFNFDEGNERVWIELSTGSTFYGTYHTLAFGAVSGRGMLNKAY